MLLTPYSRRSQCLDVYIKVLVEQVCLSNKYKYFDYSPKDSRERFTYIFFLSFFRYPMRGFSPWIYRISLSLVGWLVLIFCLLSFGFFCCWCYLYFIFNILFSTTLNITHTNFIKVHHSHAFANSILFGKLCVFHELFTFLYGYFTFALINSSFAISLFFVFVSRMSGKWLWTRVHYFCTNKLTGRRMTKLKKLHTHIHCGNICVFRPIFML